MKPSGPPLIWSAIAISAAHCGEPELVPPTTYQPALQRLPSGQTIPV